MTRTLKYLAIGSVAFLQIAFGRFVQSEELNFRHHFVDRDLPGSQWGQTALVDIDRDGDLDFITGQTKGDIRWYEYNQSDKSWTPHLLGRDSPSDVGGLAMDVDRDGRVDFVTGGAWYHQPEDAKTEAWPKHVFDNEPTKVHDIIGADLDGDGRAEVITLSDKSNLRSYTIPVHDCTAAWPMQEIWAGVHAGLSAGDIDGDGDIDLVRSQIWLENINHGNEWKEHKFCGIPWANRKEHYFYYLASRSWVTDINRDGRSDIVLTENEIPGGRIAWFEAPEDPTQPNWEPHFLEASDDEARGPFHSLQLADFDNDGDLDIFAGEMEHLANPPHRWFIWENKNGDGSQFVEHVVLDKRLGTHETQAGDVDGDGDIDLVGKLWRPVPDNGNRGHNHVDFLENLSEAKWQSLFDGKTLTGWVKKNGTATYEVKDGLIVGTTVEGSWNSFLCTEQHYGDFELQFEVRVHDQLNSGVQIRSKTRERTVGKGPNRAAGRVIGPQVEIEASREEGAEAGYIYDEATGNGWLTAKERLIPHNYFRDGQWNRYRIVARGPRIQTWINGRPIEDLTDQEAYSRYPRGFIGLQVHRVKPSAGPYDVAWRNIRVRTFESKELKRQRSRSQ